MPLFDYPTETVFTWAATPLKFGIGALAEIGEDCVSLGLRRVLVLTDARVQDGLREATTLLRALRETHAPTAPAPRSAHGPNGA